VISSDIEYFYKGFDPWAKQKFIYVLYIYIHVYTLTKIKKITKDSKHSDFIFTLSVSLCLSLSLSLSLSFFLFLFIQLDCRWKTEEKQTAISAINSARREKSIRAASRGRQDNRDIISYASWNNKGRPARRSARHPEAYDKEARPITTQTTQFAVA